ncbi:FAD:protein FMN transferase [Sphingobacterium corticis]|uniref:FAD:protein FMN transferase n=1 Tax=Sphingobacterium corticis TaxID=1812823 RepID=A0ABW5NKM3_9SPHI
MFILPSLRRLQRLLIATLAISLLGYPSVSAQDVLVRKQTTLMGSVFEITIVDVDSASAKKNIEVVIAEIDRIENLISEWRPHTQISQVNQQAGIRPVKVDREVFELTKRAIAYSEMSDGAFDISVAGLDKVWRFDGSVDTLPSGEELQKSIARVGYENIFLDSLKSTIYLKNCGMKIGFGSIGKGYAADKGRELMERSGVKGGIVNASGDMAMWGNPPKQKFWKIGVDDPFHSNKIVKTLKIKSGAIATSGSTQKFVEFDGVRYSHIINPKTGYPSTGLTSATVYGPSAEFANALSTSIMVLGAEQGRKLIKRYPNYRYIFVSDNGDIEKSK